MVVLLMCLEESSVELSTFRRQKPGVGLGNTLNSTRPNGSKDEKVNILCGPDLEKVILSDPCLEDLQKLTSKIANKEILQKLKTLVIDLDVDSFTLYVNVDQFNAIVEFIKCAAACLSNLTCLKFYLNDRRSANTPRLQKV
ncbi:Hypothetical predicted protein [Cloeon dipterum]|uniref:Uncharacterized protein n=1 Tax=Cloeon dipterum TaxID=197152 RepID=A0A8S1D972_9INSE|nr:Hypothetical predicted protein [Cloeon dipterum]